MTDASSFNINNQPAQQGTNEGTDYRGATRYKLPAMYTLVRVRPAGTQRYRWTGYVYDISLSGMRFEIDRALAPDMQVEIHAMLPGKEQVTFEATGHVVRMHDDDYAPGPKRMGMTFDSFAFVGDQQRLTTYLNQAGRLAA